LSLLTIVQSVADLVGVARPSTVIDNGDRTARQMLALLNRGGKNLAGIKNAWGGGWQILEREHVFNTVVDRAFYELPSDFGSLLGETIWNRADFESVRGPGSPSLWQVLKSGLQTSPQIQETYRIRRIDEATSPVRQMFIDPVPAAVEEHVFEYVTLNWIGNQGGTVFKAAFTADTDVPLFSENLLEQDLTWRFRKAKGLDYGADLAEFEVERDRKIAAEVGATVSLARRRFRLPVPNTPQTGFGE